MEIKMVDNNQKNEDYDPKKMVQHQLRSSHFDTESSAKSINH